MRRIAYPITFILINSCWCIISEVGNFSYKKNPTRTPKRRIRCCGKVWIWNWIWYRWEKVQLRSIIRFKRAFPSDKVLIFSTGVKSQNQLLAFKTLGTEVRIDTWRARQNDERYWVGGIDSWPSRRRSWSRSKTFQKTAIRKGHAWNWGEN